VALLHSPRLSRVVAVAVLGVVACGVSLALAGPTPRPPADPLDALPAGVSTAKEWPCVTDLLNAVSPTTTIEEPGPAQQERCFHIALVRSTTETANELADRLSKHFTERGYELGGVPSGQYRSLTGTLAQCGTTLTIDTGQDAASLPPGARAALPQVPPNGSFPGGPLVSIPGGVIDPTASTPGASIPDPGSPTVPETAPTVPPLDPSLTGQAPVGSPSDQALAADPYQIITTMLPNQKGGAVMVASQQARQVVPKALEATC
jgi:hypothetical protein